MVTDISALVKATKAAHEAHRKSKEAAKQVAKQVQAQTGYGRPAPDDGAQAGVVQDGGWS